MRPRGAHPTTHTGVAYRVAPEEPTFQGGPLHLYPRFVYWRFRPVRHQVFSARVPYQGDFIYPWVPPPGGRRHRAGWWLTWGGGWPNLEVTRSQFWRWWYRPVEPPRVIDPYKVADRRGAWIHRGRRRWRWWCRKAYRLTRGYPQGRWWTAGRYTPGMEYLRRRWQWNVTPGVVPLGRTTLLEGTNPLHRVATSLHHRARWGRRDQHGAARVVRHRRYLFERIPRWKRRRRLRRGWRRWCRWRRERLQRHQMEPTTLGGYYHRVTRGLFRRWNHRRPRLERLRLARPIRSYLDAMYTWVRTTLVPRVATPLEYNLNNEGMGYFRFMDRKAYKARRWRLGDHPRWGVPFKERQIQRWGWFHEGGLQGERAALAEAPTREAPVYNPEVPPLQGGAYAAVYWSLQPWGRGSRWRTRPTDRARYVWVSTVVGGYAQEHDAVQWSHACTAPTGVNYSQLGELEFPRVNPPGRYVRQARWTPPEDEPAVAGVPPWVVRTLVRWTYPVWWVYWVVAQGWALVLGLALWVGYYAVWWAGAPLVWGWYTLCEGWATLVDWSARVVWASPGVQTLRWTYTAWVLAYNAEDDPTDGVVPTWEEENEENFAEEEVDPTGEAMLPEAAGAVHLLREEPTSPWEWWWYKDWDDFYDEGVEMALEILTEEVSYVARLVWSPWVDFWFRLPLWAVLDGGAALVVAAKLDYQRWWWRVLSRGNTPTRVVGRWWKVPLVVGVTLLHGGAALGVGVTLAGVLDASTLHVWVVYTCGLPWHDEYYWGWIAGWVALAVRLVGPTGWRSYLEGLGWSNLGYLLVGGSSLVYPEDYYPHRSATVVRSLVNNQTLGTFFKFSYFPDEADRPKAGVLPYALVDSARVTPAAVVGYNEMPWEVDSDDGGYQAQSIPHLVDREEITPEYPRFVGGRWAHDMARRHPHHQRNNFYDVDYVTDMNTPTYTWPTYYANARNRHTRHDANLGESTIHHE